jgi:LruC domain-containing protein
LPNFAPTDLADKKQLGTNDDASNPASGIYYVSGDNWPWAMNFLQPFTYPVEAVNVKDAYLHFLDWSKSGGAGYLDWYSNTGAGYTNPANLYNK